MAGSAGEWFEDRITLASFILWAAEHGYIGKTLGDATAVMVAPRSWDVEYARYRGVVELEDAERDRADDAHVRP